MSVYTGHAVSRVQRNDDGIEVAAGERRVTVDQVLVALGRRANTGALDLPAAGVELTERGQVRVDARLRTTNPAIYAIGDVCSAQQFTHNADMQARAVIQNALFLPTARVDRAVVPHCTYTQPEVASVGSTAEMLQQAGTAYDRYVVRFAELDRGRIESDEQGFAEVLTVAGGARILGATIVGRDAGEQIAPLVLMMSHRLGLSAVARVVLAYPTRSEYLKRLADAYNRTRLTPRIAGLIRRWLALRR